MYVELKLFYTGHYQNRYDLKSIVTKKKKEIRCSFCCKFRLDISKPALFDLREHLWKICK